MSYRADIEANKEAEAFSAEALRNLGLPCDSGRSASATFLEYMRVAPPALVEKLAAKLQAKPYDVARVMELAHTAHRADRINERLDVGHKPAPPPPKNELRENIRESLGMTEAEEKPSMDDRLAARLFPGSQTEDTSGPLSVRDSIRESLHEAVPETETPQEEQADAE